MGLQAILPLLESAMQSGRPLLLIAERGRSAEGLRGALGGGALGDPYAADSFRFGRQIGERREQGRTASEALIEPAADQPCEERK
jgi:hypothetical protein